MKSEDHKRLIGVLKKMVVREKWRKMPKRKGVVVEKLLTKSGNIKLVLRDNDVVYVLKRNKNLFEEAGKLREGDFVSVMLRTHLGKQYCTKISRQKEKRLDSWV